MTEVQPVGEFWEAEPDHQDYLEKRPGGYTCHFVRPGWVLPKRQRLTTYSQRPGPRRNRLHCRCHCAGPVRNLRDRVVQRRGHRTLLQSDGSFQSVAIATPGSQIYARPLVLFRSRSAGRHLIPIACNSTQPLRPMASRSRSCLRRLAWRTSPT